MSAKKPTETDLVWHSTKYLPPDRGVYLVHTKQGWLQVASRVSGSVFDVSPAIEANGFFARGVADTDTEQPYWGLRHISR